MDYALGGLKFRYELWEWVCCGATHRKHNCFHTRERVQVPYRRASGTALESYWCDAFAGASFLNHIPKDHTEFVRSEVAALLQRGCLVN